MNSLYCPTAARGQISRSLTPLQSLLLRRWRPRWICPYRAHRAFNTTSVRQNEKPYYVTTPIFYVNAAPHVGHLYTMVLADVLKRWQVLAGKRAVLSTGTDEHGLKVQQAAQKANMDPKAFCDQGAEVFRNLASVVNISNDHFVRTTDPQHKDAVQYAWQILEDRGFIYQKKHEGWYSISDETFFPESAVKVSLDPATGRKLVVSVETGKEVQWTSEQNYHFKLSAFREKLLDWYSEDKARVVPAGRFDEVKQWVEEGLEDLSISRPVDRLTWGIPVPTDKSQTIYVWLDALLNYATKVGYPQAADFGHSGGWPADVHVVGKDIMRFHCIYWPAILMALDLPLPGQILTHGHWLLGNQKMSKSSGNGVNPFFAIDRFGIDTLRYFLIHSGGIEKDAEYDNRLVAIRYKKDLQNGLGNLASRVLYSRGWDVQRAVRCYPSLESLVQDCQSLESKDEKKAADNANKTLEGYYARVAQLSHEVQDSMNALKPNTAVQQIMRLIYEANAFFQHQAPWNIARARFFKTSPNKAPAMSKAEIEQAERKLSCVVYLAAETLRIVGVLLQPIMPEKAKSLLNSLGVDQGKRQLEHAQIGADQNYGMSRARQKSRENGIYEVLFPVLASEDLTVR